MAFRRATSAAAVELLVVGLGNPDPEYRRTRHNAGYLTADVLARRWRFPKPKRAYDGRFAAAEIGGRHVGLLQPTTYMNASGKSVASALRGTGLDAARLLVVHDEIDFTFGRLQLRRDGGHGGHNGLRSLHELVGREFDRLRIGVGRPASTDPAIVADYVLSRFDEPDDDVGRLIDRAADAVEAWVRLGIDAAASELDGSGRGDAPA